MPVAFAQVREDPRIDRWVVEQCATDSRDIEIIQIASGGCTAAVLAAMPQVARVHLVDPNPAQLALARLKLRSLRCDEPGKRATVFGHASMSVESRAAALHTALFELDLGADCLGPMHEVARLGPDHAGRYELLFAALRQQLKPLAVEINDLLELSDIDQQRQRSEPTTMLGRTIDLAVAEVMSLENLVQLFGVRATGNAVQPFHQHFSQRIRHVLSTLPAATNPWLWQMLRGVYPPHCPIEWLTLPQQKHQADLSWSQNEMDAALSTMEGRVHLVHLSNILDWLTVDEASHTLALAWRALRPGGWVVIRQLNSSLNIPTLCPEFTWEVDAAAMLHRQDRSFFYRALHLGRKR